MKKIIYTTVLSFFTISCVSKKEYLELESKFKTAQRNLQKTTSEKDVLERKINFIAKRAEAYNSNINALKSLNTNLKEENNNKLVLIDNNIVISNSMKLKMKETLLNVDPSIIAKAESLKDSINLVISHNLKKNLKESQLDRFHDLNIHIDKTVVMITVGDNLLFKTGSYSVKHEAYKLLEQFSSIIKSEPSIDVMVEGHTDSRDINTLVIKDNWDLSVKRATSVVRILEDKFGIASNRLIAAGRGSSMPLYENTSAESRARNRRTRLVILPNIDKFFSMINQEQNFLD